MDPVSSMLVVVSALILLGAVGEFVFSKTGIPDAVWMVVAGILLGPVFNVVSSELLTPAVPFFGAIALTVILTGGAYRLKLGEVIKAAPHGLQLAFIGFLFSILAMCIFSWVNIQIGWMSPSSAFYWVLIGGILGGSSALIIMPTVASGKVDAVIARTLEVESSTTDALCVVVVMALLELLVRGFSDISQPFVTLARQIGIGIGSGIIWTVLSIPFYPLVRRMNHSYTLLIASMFLLYALTSLAEGNGAMAVLTAALLLGNASTIVPKVIPGAQGQAFEPSVDGLTMQSQMTFLIKSFFFVLIGLMFPEEPRAILLGIAAGIVLLIFRIPAVAIALRDHRFTRKQKLVCIVAMPRGLAAGVLSTLPAQAGIPNTSMLSGAVFAAIVTTILLFSLGVAIVERMRD